MVTLDFTGSELETKRCALGWAGSSSWRGFDPHSEQPFRTQHSERTFMQPSLEVRSRRLSVRDVVCLPNSNCSHPQLLEMELDVLYAHIASLPVAAGLPALARSIAHKELPHGADIIVGIHARLLKERQTLPSTPMAAVPPPLSSPSYFPPPHPSDRLGLPPPIDTTDTTPTEPASPMFGPWGGGWGSEKPTKGVEKKGNAKIITGKKKGKVNPVEAT